MKNTLRILLLAFLAIGLAACDAPAATTTPSVVAPTVVEFADPVLEATPTAEPTPDSTPTPEVPAPTADANLSPVNNAKTVLENNTWVVKNADGQVTATWNGTEWAYNTEFLKLTRTIIGFDGEDASLLDPLFENPLPEDTPENHFIDPKTGEPLPYGYFRESSTEISLTDGNKYEIPFSLYAVRMVGAVQVDETDSAVVLELPISPDRSSVFVIPNVLEDGTDFCGIKDERLYDEEIISDLRVALTASKNPEAYNNIRGQQVLMAVFHDIPENFAKSDSLWDINEVSAVMQQYLKNPSTAIVPRVSMSHFIMSPILPWRVYVPLPVVDELISK